MCNEIDKSGATEVVKSSPAPQRSVRTFQSSRMHYRVEQCGRLACRESTNFDSSVGIKDPEPFQEVCTSISTLSSDMVG